MVTFFSFVGFHCVLSSIFVTTCFLSCSPLSCMAFRTISSRFLHFMHFQFFFPRVLPISFSFRSFCTISSGCYRIFLHFHCIFPACLLHRHSLFLAVAPVSSMFQQILNLYSGCYHIFLHCIFPAFSSGFCTISSDCYHVFLQFLYPLRGFSVYSCIFNLFFQDFYPSPFCTISSGLLHFQCIFPRILPVSFIFRSFLYLFSHCDLKPYRHSDRN